MMRGVSRYSSTTVQQAEGEDPSVWVLRGLFLQRAEEIGASMLLSFVVLHHANMHAAAA